jgi:hypothetical protein
MKKKLHLAVHIFHICDKQKNCGVAEEGEGEVEELTSHYVQLQDGTYAQMVEGHHIVKPGQQMLVRPESIVLDHEIAPPSWAVRLSAGGCKEMASILADK